MKQTRKDGPLTHLNHDGRISVFTVPTRAELIESTSAEGTGKSQGPTEFFSGQQYSR